MKNIHYYGQAISIQDFIDDYLKPMGGTNVMHYELLDVLSQVNKIIIQNRDATPEELLELVIEDNVTTIQDFMHNNPVVPGCVIGVNVNNIDVQFTGGYKEGNIIMPEDAIFDLASITKLYTQIIAQNLMDEGAFSSFDYIKDLDPRFKNLEYVTIGDLTRFGVAFDTLGRIDEKPTLEEAKECLYSASVKKSKIINKVEVPVRIGDYDYNDIGMMILKEVMEKVTGRTFKDLVNHYIIVKLGVPNTHLVVPNFKTDLITGTPNAQYGLPNDKTAVILGGYSGHAGMFSTSKDLITAGKGATSILLPEDKIHYLWTQGLKLNRGYMGNTYVPLGGGLKDTLVDVYSLRRSFAVQGSTRGQLNAGVDHASTILLNPSSMSYEQAEELLGKNPRTVQKYFAMKDGKQIECKLIDPRTIVPIDNVSPITTANAKLTLKLMFLKYIFQKENYEKEVKVKRRVI